MLEKYQVVVIGGGPGGYVCAIRLSQLGYKTACIDHNDTLGGTCLNVGCIPSKSLLNLSEKFHNAKNLSEKGIEIGEIRLNLEKMMKNKEKAVSTLTKGVEFLLKKNKVFIIKGHASFKDVNKILITDKNKNEKTIETEKTVICSGSEPISLPKVNFDEKRILSSTGALSLKSVPKKMVIIGAGYIGLEMGSVWSRLGSEIHIIEFLDHITTQVWIVKFQKEFLKILQKQG
jgi:Pyruvate/2-oxoglutarate dehydrogenase complex, dihydrolipoamide dehydrogenase (E3) component, and related enzymes